MKIRLSKFILFFILSFIYESSTKVNSSPYLEDVGCNVTNYCLQKYLDNETLALLSRAAAASPAVTTTSFADYGWQIAVGSGIAIVSTALIKPVYNNFLVPGGRMFSSGAKFTKEIVSNQLYRYTRAECFRVPNIGKRKMNDIEKILKPSLTSYWINILKTIDLSLKEDFGVSDRLLNLKGPKNIL